MPFVPSFASLQFAPGVNLASSKSSASAALVRLSNIRPSQDVRITQQPVPPTERKTLSKIGRATASKAPCLSRSTASSEPSIKSCLRLISGFNPNFIAERNHEAAIGELTALLGD